MNQGMAPVTFSVANVMKRVFVVVSTVIVFGNPVSWVNWLGSSIAIFGTFLYSIAKQRASKEAAAKSAWSGWNAQAKHSDFFPNYLMQPVGLSYLILLMQRTAAPTEVWRYASSLSLELFGETAANLDIGWNYALEL